MDQGRGRMTRIFLFCLFKSNSLFLQLYKYELEGVRFLSVLCTTAPHPSPVSRLRRLSMEIITLHCCRTNYKDEAGNQKKICVKGQQDRGNTPS